MYCVDIFYIFLLLLSQKSTVMVKRLTINITAISEIYLKFSNFIYHQSLILQVSFIKRLDFYILSKFTLNGNCGLTARRVVESVLIFFYTSVLLAGVQYEQNCNVNGISIQYEISCIYNSVWYN